MAQNEITIPRIDALDDDSLIFEYDERSDSLYVHLVRPGSPGVSVATDEHVLLRVDPETNILIGIEIEAFLTDAVNEKPELLIFAELAAIDPDVMARWRSSQPAREAGVSAIFQLLRKSRVA